MRLFDKILIANRGEVAVRIIRTAKSLGIATVAVFATDDANSLHVELADAAILLKGNTLAETYLNQKKMIQLAKENSVEAIHPGYGFLSENADFAASVEKEGLVFIGATPSQIRLMGEKTHAIEFAKKLKVPVVPSLHGAVNDILSNVAFLEFPVLVKASAGGGGKGMQLVCSAKEFPLALQKAKRQVGEYFDSGGIFVEKYLTKSRHIEVQVFGDGRGNAVHLFERECSIQRHYQKLIEETPATSISNSLKEKLFDTAIRIAQEIQYRGAGTVEFLVDEEENYYFLEMNTRLQVEHPVTEMITGLDVVEWQVQIAAGQGLPKLQKEISQNGHAIELRLCAEDPLSDFHPVAGEVSQLNIPDELDFRFDSFLRERVQLSSNYDSLIGKLIARGNDRNEAIENMLSFSEKVMTVGLKTNLQFLRTILKNDNFVQNKIDTRFVENHLEPLKTILVSEHDKTKQVIPVIAYCIHHFYNTGNTGNTWEKIGYHRLFNDFNIEVEGESKLVSMKSTKFGIDFLINEEFFSVTDILQEQNCMSFFLEGVRINNLLASQSRFTWIQVDGHQFKVRSNHVLEEALVSKKHDLQASQKEINVFADLFGKVIQLHVQDGDEVELNQALLTIESMKTEFKILSPSKGFIKQLHVETGSVVQDKQLLIEFESKNKIIVSA